MSFSCSMVSRLAPRGAEDCVAARAMTMSATNDRVNAISGRRFFIASAVYIDSSLSMESHQPTQPNPTFRTHDTNCGYSRGFVAACEERFDRVAGICGQQVSRGGADMKRIMGSLAVLMALAFAATVSAQVQTG